MNFYKKLFYSFYKYFDTIGRSIDPAFMATTFLSMWVAFLIFNIISFCDLMEFGIPVGYPEISGIVLMLLILFPNYYYFVYKENYLKIEYFFLKNPRKILNHWLALIIFFLPLLTLGGLIYLIKS